MILGACWGYNLSSCMLAATLFGPAQILLVFAGCVLLSMLLVAAVGFVVGFVAFDV